MSNQQADMRQHEQEMREAFKKEYGYPMPMATARSSTWELAWQAATLAAEARIRELEADANLWRFVYYSEDYAVCSYEDGRGSSQGRSDYEPVLLEQIDAALSEHKENQG